MKKTFIIGNWKSYKNSMEATAWLTEMQNMSVKESKEVVICPPLTLLPLVKSFIQKQSLPLTIGAQNISSFDEGAYTGEVNGKQLEEFVNYVIIGHSERRNLLQENEDVIVKKLVMAKKYRLIPILCISNLNQLHTILSSISLSDAIIAYEPVGAIGSGHPDSVSHAKEMAAMIKKILPQAKVLYGGSITPENVASFTKTVEIDGVLVGGHSLDTYTFMQIIDYA